VKPDWSDLEATIVWLRRNPESASGITRRQREAFYGLYHLPAAEVCYWWKLISEWNSVAEEVPSKFPLGTRWESYALMGELSWEKTA